MDLRGSTVGDLERMLLDGDAETKALPLPLLVEITNGFSDELEIGRGGFSVVYKGILENTIVAVKRLSNMYINEKEFDREVECLMKVQHKNIVQFLGYCSDAQQIMERYNGKFVMADVHQRLLCFEYLPNGSLADYITDSSTGLEWRMRYKIIKGICEGLNYLHQNHIVHLDLKPANILMDENMVPKISDFGLSMCFEQKETDVIVTQMRGTMGYLAPEFTSHRITYKFDLYSLGVIIIEMLTGKKGYQAVENVLESWSNRAHILQQKQIRVCTSIGMDCTNFNPAKRPQSVMEIIDRLEEVELTQEVTVGENYTPKREMIYPSKIIQGFSGPLEVHPLQLRFPFQHNMSIPCLLHLQNNTDEHVAFRLEEKSQRVLIWPIHGLIPPRSTHSLLVVAQRRKTFPEKGNFLILHSISVSNVDFINIFTGDYEKLWKHVKELGNTVHEVTIEAVYTPEGETTSEAIPQGIKIISIMDNLGHLFSVDANTKEPWVAIRRSGQAQKATIMDYVTQEQMGTLEATTWGAASSPKFIAEEEWIMVPSADDDGHVNVYNYKMENIDAFKVGRYAVTNLAIHPTNLSVLSKCWASKEIKLWVCDDGWKLSRTFMPESTVNKVVFNPKDTNINGFAISCDDHTIELWDLDSSECSSTLAGHQDEVNCLEFFTREDQQQYLISGSNDKTAKIWDIQTMACVHTLEGFMSPVMCVFGHANLPVLSTGTEDGIIHLWSSTDFRLKKILNMGSCGEVLSLALACPVESRRVVIGQSGAISIMDFGGEGEWEEEGDEREEQY